MPNLFSIEAFGLVKGSALFGSYHTVRSGIKSMAEQNLQASF